MTPLHWAASRGNVHIARLLHQFGAELNATDKVSQWQQFTHLTPTLRC